KLQVGRGVSMVIGKTSVLGTQTQRFESGVKTLGIAYPCYRMQPGSRRKVVQRQGRSILQTPPALGCQLHFIRAWRLLRQGLAEIAIDHQQIHLSQPTQGFAQRPHRQTMAVAKAPFSIHNDNLQIPTELVVLESVVTQ